MSDERKIYPYLDILRIIAVITVLYVHTPAEQAYPLTAGLHRFVYIFLSGFSAMNVPLFLMISGALLLGKKTYAGEIRKRLLRTISAFLLFTILAWSAYKIRIDRSVSAGILLEALLGNYGSEGFLSLALPYWYLFAYAAYLLMLPLLRKLVQNMTEKEYKYLASLACFMCLLSFAYKIGNVFGYAMIPYNSTFEIPLATSVIIIYPMMGYAAHHFIVPDTKKKWISVTVLIASVTLSSIMEYAGYARNGWAPAFIGSLRFFTALSFFVFIKCLFSKKKETKHISSLSQLVFGIYLMDPVVRILFQNNFINSSALSSMPLLFRCILWCILEFFFSAVITTVLRKIPLMRKMM